MIDVALTRELPGFVLDVAFANRDGITALVGPSGSGKSMTLGLIAGLARPDSGHVRVGRATLLDLPKICVPMHKRRVGLVFQDSHLFPHLTVRQNLAFGRWFAPRAERGVVDLEAVVETLGIGALLARRPSGLSGGERQRVAIGRALLACPRLLLFDEPFAALDRSRKLEILPLIEQLRDRFAIPIVYVSHALEEVVRLAAHVVVLQQGRVAAQGDPALILGAQYRQAEPRFGRASVLEAIVGFHDEAYGLTALDHPAGTLWLAGRGGVPGRRARVLVQATDVSLASGAPGATSIQSALAGHIVGIAPGNALAAVEIALQGGGRLDALVTRRALDDLDLAIGSPVTAMIKTVALDEGLVMNGG